MKVLAKGDRHFKSRTKQSGNNSVLIDQLRAAIKSRVHDGETIERSNSNAGLDEREMAWTCSSNKLTIEDLSSFIEVKVKEFCCFEIDNLKSEASASYYYRMRTKELESHQQEPFNSYLTNEQRTSKPK